MTLQDAQIHELEMLARHEEAIGGLYKAYAERFQEHKDFWTRLAGEERGHASWIRRLFPKAEEGIITFDDARFNTKAIDTSLMYIEHWVHEAQNEPVEIVKALSVALDIESSLIEKNYFKVFESDNKEMKHVLNGLAQGCREHRDRIQQLLTEVRRTGDHESDVAIG
jgi:rubrerythrin